MGNIRGKERKSEIEQERKGNFSRTRNESDKSFAPHLQSGKMRHQFMRKLFSNSPPAAAVELLYHLNLPLSFNFLSLINFKCLPLALTFIYLCVLLFIFISLTCLYVPPPQQRRKMNGENYFVKDKAAAAVAGWMGIKRKHRTHIYTRNLFLLLQAFHRAPLSPWIFNNFRINNNLLWNIFSEFYFSLSCYLSLSSLSACSISCSSLFTKGDTLLNFFLSLHIFLIYEQCDKAKEVKKINSFNVLWRWQFVLRKSSHAD